MPAEIRRNYLHRAVAFAVAAVLAATVMPVAARGQAVPTQDAAMAAIAAQVSRNEEAADKVRPKYFFFSEERSDRTDQHLWREATAETAHGPLRRLLAEDGHPLDAERQRQVDDRVRALAADPAALEALNHNRIADQRHGEQLLRLPAGMYLYKEVSRQNGVLTVAFAPDPSYVPQTYEERVLHTVGGDFQVDEAKLRTRQVDAKLLEVVKFGFGLLGSVQSGEVHMVRVETAHGDYKTAELDFKVAGHVLFFRTLGREQHLTRHGYVLLPENQTLEDAARTVLQAKE